MSATVGLEEARRILGDDVLGPQEVTRAFGPPPQLAIPFSAEALNNAKHRGEMLVLRIATGNGANAITILNLIERFPQAFDNKLLRQVGYQLKDDWGISLEPLAASDTCTPG